MYEKFECKYLNISDVILSLYHKTIKHASSCANSSQMAIKAQLYTTQITVFIIRIYVRNVKFYVLDDQGFNTLEEARNFSRPKNVQMSSKSTQPPTGVLKLEHKTGHSQNLLQRLRMSGPTVLLSHMP